MRTLGKILIGLLASVGFIVIVFMGLGIYAASRWEATRQVQRAPDRFVLTLNLDNAFDESAGDGGLTALKLGPHLTFQNAVLALKRAKDDPRVIGVAASLNDQSLGIARIQELRDLIGQIRTAGKPTTLFSESIGEGTGAMSSYYLASAFGDIWVQPSGDVGIAEYRRRAAVFQKAARPHRCEGEFYQAQGIQERRREPDRREHVAGESRGIAGVARRLVRPDGDRRRH